MASNIVTQTSAFITLRPQPSTITPLSHHSAPTQPSSSIFDCSDNPSNGGLAFSRNHVDSDDDGPSSPSGGYRKGNVEQSLTFLRGQKRMRDESESDLKIWLGLKDDREARRGREYAALLQLRDELREAGLIGKKKTFEISEDLKVEIKSYSWMVASSPGLRSYRGAAPPGIVWAAMRALNIEGLPSDSAAADKKKVKSKVTNALTTIRHEIKEIITGSVGPQAKGPQFITSISKTIAQKGKIQITMKFLQRIALLLKFAKRAFFKDLPPGTQEDEFWKVVDTKLQKYEERYASKPAEYKKLLEGILKHDTRTYPRQDKEDDIKVCMRLAKGGVVINEG
ncbi:hypothetical protein M422DRAFT_49165 [Sphaerobolus stellatus SS14]|uniref:Uncharacterized protein n=1 Tax=Sphaerobolus stellatus (strain SS14) TaxID=990650 RepID=A0A0C9VQH0_SPHS4|nr:hypothetical protein M422DRAFT_49165 [Sphaerobolus stellatus SS14]